MSYFATYIINGIPIKFSDFGIILDPKKDLNDEDYLEALRIATIHYDVLNAINNMRDWGSNDLTYAGESHLSDLLNMADQAESQNLIALDEHERSIISKIRNEKYNRDMGRNHRRHEEKPQPKRGYVYLLKSEMGQYKIGKTNNPKHRSKMLGLSLPFNVELEHLIKTSDMASLETTLHTHFKERHINGEWFDLSPEDVAYIKSLGGEQ